MAEPDDSLVAKSSPSSLSTDLAASEQAIARRVEPLLADQETRWERGERVLVEAYLEEQPTLQLHPEAVLDLLYHEIVLREGRGEMPVLTEYTRRFPHLAQELAAQFEFDRAIQGERTRSRGSGVRSQGSYSRNSTALVPGPEGAGAADLPARVGRYRVEEEIARGGMGRIVRVRDEDFDRPLALKVLLGRGIEVEERFLREARMTGLLQHPGIPPVHALGRLEDGRPYFVMKLIQGRSLEALLKEQFSREPGASAAADLPRLAGIFKHICQTVGYAHARGVIHRDLKPANVMVGAFGEVQVMDWGLAKFLDRGNPEDADNVKSQDTVFRLGRAAALVEETAAGSVLGTPAYMSPEQAAGRLDKMGLASDVYSLGATLYSLLTGRAPFEGKRSAEVLRRVCQGAFLPPRQVKPGVPAALEAVCLKAMALRPEDRYASAQALANEIEHWLSDEPVSAWPEPITVKAGRWMRRHKAVVSGAAAAVLVGLMALTAGILWHHRHQAEVARKVALTEQETGLALSQTQKVHEDLLKKLRQRGGVFELLNHPEDWQARIQMAQGGLDRARSLLASAEEGAEPALTVRAGQLERLLQQDEDDRLLAVRLEKIRVDRAAWVEGRFDNKKAGAEYPRVFSAAGLEILSGEQNRVAQHIGSMPIKEQVVAALDDWALVALANRNQDLPERILTVARAVAPDPAWGDRLRQPKTWRSQEALTALAREGPGAGLSPQLLELVGALLHDNNPCKQTWLRLAQARFPADFWLNFALANALPSSDAVEAAGFYRVALALRPGTSAAYNNLGIALATQQKLPEAVAAYRKAIALDSKFAEAFNNLGKALADQQKLPEAIDAYNMAIALDPKKAVAHYNLGNALRAQKRLPEAIATFRKAIALDPKFALAYNSLGNALRGQEKLPEAIDAYNMASALDPKLGGAYYNLGNVLRAQEKMPEAIAAYRKAIALDPKYALAYYSLGLALYAQQNLPDAIAAFRQAIALDSKHAFAYYHLGNALRDQQKLPEAIAAYDQAIALDPKNALLYNNLGVALAAQKKLPEAIVAYNKAIDLDPNFAKSYNNLGIALAAQQNLPEAIAAYRKAIALDPKNALAYNNVGIALADQKKLPEAIVAYNQAIDLDPKFARAYTNLGIALRARKKLREAGAACRRAIALDPNDAEAYNSLGIVLRDQRKLPEAIAAYRKAIAVDPKYAKAYNSLGIALADQNKLPEAVAAYHKAIALDLEYAPAYYNLGIALRAQGKLPEASAAYRKAIAINPTYAEAHCNLGLALLAQGEMAQGLAALRRGDELGRQRAEWGYHSEEWVRSAERLAKLERNLPAILSGKQQPASAGEKIQYAQVCRWKGLYAAAARFYEQAFDAEPKLAEDLKTGNRYNAACAACLSAAGQGEGSGIRSRESGVRDQESSKIDDKERARWRRQAVAWLRADLGLWAKQLAGAKPQARAVVQQRLSHWQEDSDFAGIREAAARAKLPAEEQAACRALWADVAALLKKAAGTP